MNYHFEDIEDLTYNLNLRQTRSRSNVSGIDNKYIGRKGILPTGRYVNDYNKRSIDIGFLCQSITFGKVRPLFSKKGTLVDSRFNRLYPELYTELKYMIYCLNPGFEYTNICVNHNLICAPHRDKNKGNSLIVAWGSYTNGELVVENKLYDIKYKPLIFDGSRLTHYTNQFEGDRWSAIFYK